MCYFNIPIDSWGVHYICHISKYVIQCTFLYSIISVTAQTTLTITNYLICAEFSFFNFNFVWDNLHCGNIKLTNQQTPPGKHAFSCHAASFFFPCYRQKHPSPTTNHMLTCEVTMATDNQFLTLLSFIIHPILGKLPALPRTISLPEASP